MKVVDITPKEEETFTIEVVYKDGLSDHWDKCQGIDFEFTPEGYGVIHADDSLTLLMHHTIASLHMHKEAV